MKSSIIATCLCLMYSTAYADERLRGDWNFTMQGYNGNFSLALNCQLSVRPDGVVRRGGKCNMVSEAFLVNPIKCNVKGGKWEIDEEGNVTGTTRICRRNWLFFGAQLSPNEMTIKGIGMQESLEFTAIFDISR